MIISDLSVAESFTENSVAAPEHLKKNPHSPNSPGLTPGLRSPSKPLHHSNSTGEEPVRTLTCRLEHSIRLLSSTSVQAQEESLYKSVDINDDIPPPSC